MEDPFDLKKERLRFGKICSPREFERIMNVQNGHDHILRMRAETIADDSRLYRVFLYKVREYEERGEEWALEKYFKAYNYAYLNAGAASAAAFLSSTSRSSFSM